MSVQNQNDPEQAKLRLAAEIELRKLMATETAKESASKYLGKHAIVPTTYAPRVTLDQIAKANEWDPAKK